MAQFLLSEYNEIRKGKLQLNQRAFDLTLEKAKEVCVLQAENQKSVHLITSPFCVPGTRHCNRWLLLKLINRIYEKVLFGGFSLLERGDDFRSLLCQDLGIEGTVTSEGE